MKQTKQAKQKDLEIIKHLRANSRQTLTAISKENKIPVSTLFDRLKLYKKDEIIKRFTCLLDFQKLGYNSHSFAVFSIPKAKRKSLKEFLKKSPSVNSIYKINHRYDFLAELVFENIKGLEDFLDQIDDKFSIRPKHVFYVVTPLTNETFLKRKSGSEEWEMT